MLVPLILTVGVAQYAWVAFEGIASGNLVIWSMTETAMEDAGPLRYIKDSFLLLLSILWPLRINSLGLSPAVNQIIKMYFMWMLAIVVIGVVGIALDYSPLFFFKAGLRWLMLLHAAFGVFLLMRGCEFGTNDRKVVLFLLGLAALDLVVIAMQMGMGGARYDVELGRSRLTGLFNNAGISGFFGFTLAACGFCMRSAPIRLRLVLAVAAIIIALSSGTRSMVILAAILLAAQILEGARSLPARVRPVVRLCALPCILLVSWNGYRQLIETVDRGDMIGTQFEQGGRASNFIMMFDEIYRSDVGELMVGRGLGIGTNTAYSILAGSGVSPESYRYNWLVDNAFLTQYFQFGIIGSIVFWGGLAFFVLRMRRRLTQPSRKYYDLSVMFAFLICWAGNPFEHYFIMMPLAIMMGSFYWRGINTGSGKRGTVLGTGA